MLPFWAHRNDTNAPHEIQNMSFFQPSFPQTARMIGWWTIVLCLGACTKTNTPPLDVILISIDTLRADRVTPALMPSLVELRDEGMNFSQAYSPANESLLSHAALFTGKPASEWGKLNYTDYRLPASAYTLAQAFKDAGYQTEALVGGGHVSAIFGFNNGFDEFKTGSHFSGFAQTIPMAIDAIQEPSEKARFLFVHGYDCHTPYIKPGPAGRVMSPGYEGPFLELAHNPITYERIYKTHYAPDFQPNEIFTERGPSFLSTDLFEALPEHIATSKTTVPLDDDDIQFLIGTYDAAVLYADMWLSILFEEISALDRLDQTVIAVISDHGEDLLDHGVFNHRAGLWDSTTHVPMIIAGPGIPQTNIDVPVSTRDIGAILLGSADIHDHNFPGHDWRKSAPENRPPVLSEGIGLDAVIR